MGSSSACCQTLVTIVNWERGVRQPGLESLVRLRGIFGTSLDRLVFGPAVHKEPRRPRPTLLLNPWLRALGEQTDVPVPLIAALIDAMQTYLAGYSFEKNDEEESGTPT